MLTGGTAERGDFRRGGVNLRRSRGADLTDVVGAASFAGDRTGAGGDTCSVEAVFVSASGRRNPGRCQAAGGYFGLRRRRLARCRAFGNGNIGFAVPALTFLPASARNLSGHGRRRGGRHRLGLGAANVRWHARPAQQQPEQGSAPSAPRPPVRPAATRAPAVCVLCCANTASGPRPGRVAGKIPREPRAAGPPRQAQRQDRHRQHDGGETENESTGA